MVRFTLDKERGILHVQPQGPLAGADFERMAAEVDPYLEAAGRLTGLMIETEYFPGWQDLPSMLAHFKFVKGHHEKFTKVALVTDAGIADILPRLAGHFVVAELKHFAYSDRVAAEKWLSAD